MVGASISASYGVGVEGGDLGEEGSSSNNPGQLMTQQQSSTDYTFRTVALGASANYVEVDQANGNAAQNKKPRWWIFIYI